jgi:hypothetical protein
MRERVEAAARALKGGVGSERLARLARELVGEAPPGGVDAEPGPGNI